MDQFERFFLKYLDSQEFEERAILLVKRDDSDHPSEKLL